MDKAFDVILAVLAATLFVKTNSAALAMDASVVIAVTLEYGNNILAVSKLFNLVSKPATLFAYNAEGVVPKIVVPKSTHALE